MRRLACLQTNRISVPCSRCGVRSDVVHLSGDQPSIYCPSCCPVCSPAPSSEEAA
jgi:hypothetical protein